MSTRPRSPAPPDPAAASRDAEALVPTGRGSGTVRIGRRVVPLTNLAKPFWPDEGIAKGDLLRYYAAVSPWLLPHLKNRAMVMKRFPNGATGKCFFMKRTPPGAPAWLRTCAIEHGSGSVIDFPLINDLAALLWVVNLGCIDLNPWYSRCADVDRPDFLHFDLDPVEGTSFAAVREAALLVRDALAALELPSYPKTSGGTGMHVYVPIVRGPAQKRVWALAKEIARAMAARHPDVLTAEYRIAKRPAGRVLVDYNQNAWGRTLASVYSVRPRPGAPVSVPVTWAEVEGGVEPADFTLRDVPARLRAGGDGWAPVLARRGRADLRRFLP